MFCCLYNYKNKNKAKILIDRKQGTDKVHKFLKENGISTIKQDPTTKFLKQIQKTIKSCTQLVGKKTQGYLTQIQPRAPLLNALIKTNKTNMPIRPVVNNKFAPAHNLAKFLNTKIKNWQILPNTYNASNSLTTAEDLITLNIMPNNKIITLDINDLYTNHPPREL